LLNCNNKGIRNYFSLSEFLGVLYADNASLKTLAGKNILALSGGNNASSNSYCGGIAYDANNGLSVELEWMRYASDISAASLFGVFRF